MLQYEGLDDIDIALATQLCGSEWEAERLVAAFGRSREPLDGSVLSVYQEDFQLMCYWYAVSKARKRAADGNKQEWQLYEDYLEAACKGMNSRIIVSAHLNKMGGTYNG